MSAPAVTESDLSQLGMEESLGMAEERQINKAAEEAASWNTGRFLEKKKEIARESPSAQLLVSARGDVRVRSLKQTTRNRIASKNPESRILAELRQKFERNNTTGFYWASKRNGTGFKQNFRWNFAGFL
jgi:hypothetical protein